MELSVQLERQTQSKGLQQDILWLMMEVVQDRVSARDRGTQPGQRVRRLLEGGTPNLSPGG